MYKGARGKEVLLLLLVVVLREEEMVWLSHDCAARRRGALKARSVSKVAARLNWMPMVELRRVGCWDQGGRVLGIEG